MKWDQSVKQPDGSWKRVAYFQDHVNAYELTEDTSVGNYGYPYRIVLRDHSGEALGHISKCQERGQWLVGILYLNDNGFKKLRHRVLGSKDDAIEYLLKEVS